MSGALVVVGTPIGNLDDLSPRAARALTGADLVACEDTRVTRTLMERARSLSGVDRRPKLIAYHAHNERARASELVHAVARGLRVVLVTDAGMPVLSDPGRHLVAECAEAGLRVEVVPGPSAVPAAIVLSGLPAARFVFEGFLPRTGSARRRRLETIAREERTIVFFEAPHRLADTLTAMADVLGPRRAVIAREMTKIHEEVVRGTLPELAAAVAERGARGEITLVVEGAPEPERATGEGQEAELAAEVVALVAGGLTKRDAIARVAADRKIPKRVVYRATLGGDEEE